MSFKTRIAFSFGLFILLTAGLGAGLMVNSWREEKAFHSGRNALRLQFMTQEVDYFVNKKIRGVEAYVLLGEDLEKYVIEEANMVLQKKFEVWDKWVKSGDASSVELAQVREVYGKLHETEQNIQSLMDRRDKAEAIRLVGGEFRPRAKAARDKLKDITAQKIRDAVEAERAMQRVVRQGHLTSVAGVLLAIILGVVLAMSLYNSVMLPMKVLFMWSDQIAKGRLHVSLDIPGDNEMGRLAQNFNDMVQSLARQNQDQVDKERARIVLDRQKEKELEVEKELQRRRQDREQQEEVNSLEDAVEGFREILDIMGGPKDKK
jgi:methyl-accepting chemotaxis protein